MWPVHRTGFGGRAKGESETRQGLSFPKSLEGTPPAEKFSRPLRGARFPAEHAGIKAAGAWAAPVEIGWQRRRPPRCVDVPLSGTHGIELVFRAVK